MKSLKRCLALLMAVFLLLSVFCAISEEDAAASMPVAEESAQINDTRQETEPPVSEAVGDSPDDTPDEDAGQDAVEEAEDPVPDENGDTVNEDEPSAEEGDPADENAPDMSVEPDAEEEPELSDELPDTEEILEPEAGLTMSVDYPETILCGSSIDFTVTAENGSGQYKYYLNFIQRKDDGSYYFVTDLTRYTYSENNTFSFTFMSSGDYQLRFYVMDYGASPVATLSKTIDITISDPAYPAIETIADNVAAQCEAACGSDYEKALWLHDWILTHCKYDNSYTYCGAEGVLVRGTGTCEAYHRAYAMLLRRVGIACEREIGNGHCWTKVKLDGNWYQVDVTWDDNGRSSLDSYESHLYFGLTDHIMKLVHSDHSGSGSTHLEYNYLIRSGMITRWSDPLKTQIQQRLDAGETAFELTITDSLPDGYKNVLYNLAAWQLTKESWTVSGCAYKLEATYADSVLTVKASPVAATFRYVSGATIGVGETYCPELLAEPAAAFGVISYSSSKASVAAVNAETGEVRGIRAGTVYITARAQDGTVTKCKITVKRAATKIKLNTGSVTLAVGETFRLKETVTNASAARYWNATDDTVVAVANGELEAKATGTAVVTVSTFNGRSAQCSVTVVDAPEEMYVGQEEIVIGCGQKYRIPVSLYPETAGGRIFYETDAPKVAKVSSDGVITAQKSCGSAVITVKTYNSIERIIHVTVMPAPRKVTLNTTRLTMGVGEMYSLSAIIPEGTATAFTYSSSRRSVVTVDAQGNLVALKAGKARITVKTHNGKRATCTVTVKPAVREITVSDFELGVGMTKSVAYTLLPAGSGTLRCGIESFHPSVIEVDENGRLRAVGEGEAVLYIYADNGAYGLFSVTVVPAPTAIELNAEAVALRRGKSCQLTVTADRGMGSYTFSSSDPRIATVSASGKIVGKRKGKAVITVTCVNSAENAQAQCEVTVR